MLQINLGDRVRDCVTKAEGVVVGRTQWLTGCDQCIVQPGKFSAEGKLSDSLWFDVSRLEVIEAGAIKLPNPPDAQASRPGGFQPGY